MKKTNPYEHLATVFGEYQANISKGQKEILIKFGKWLDGAFEEKKDEKK